MKSASWNFQDPSLSASMQCRSPKVTARLAVREVIGLGTPGTPASLRIPSGTFSAPAGDTEEQQAKPERALSGSLERQIGQDSPPVSLTEMLQVSPTLLIRSHTSHYY